MTDQIAHTLKLFRRAVERHDHKNPTHPPAHAIALNPADCTRLGFEDDESLWAGVSLVADAKVQPKRFTVVCGYQPEDTPSGEVVEAVGREVAA
jgi:hypothetical protein